MIKNFPDAITLYVTAPITVSIWNHATARSYSAETYVSISGKGNVQAGYKFVAEKLSNIDTNTGDINYLPGTLPGYTATGGVYT
jgi:hypothetical protein